MDFFILTTLLITIILVSVWYFVLSSTVKDFIRKLLIKIYVATYSSKKKGNHFEKHVADRFTKEYYRIIRWQGDKVSSSGMYAEESSDPDMIVKFKLRE